MLELHPGAPGLRAITRSLDHPVTRSLKRRYVLGEEFPQNVAAFVGFRYSDIKFVEAYFLS
jgi:hypothetical protein